MVKLCNVKKSNGRRSLFCTIYTGTQDIVSRYKRILKQARLKTGVLRSTVDTSKREDWIMD